MGTREQLDENLERCTRCPDMCAFACPEFFASKKQTLLPSHKAHVGKLLLNGVLDPGPEEIESLYQCIDCRLCKKWCMYDDIDLPDLLHQVRSIVIDNSGTDFLPTHVKSIKNNYERYGLPYDSSNRPQNEQTTKDLSEMRSDESDILFFAGCTTRFYQPEIGVASLKVLQLMGVKAAFSMEKEPCCGRPLLDMGFSELARQAGESTKAYIEESKCNLVLSNCPSCVFTLTELLKQVNSDIRVMYLPEYLAQAVEDKKVNFINVNETKVTFDDDPYLARYIQKSEEPRKVLAAMPGIELVEMLYNKQIAHPGTCYFGLPDPVLEKVILSRRLEQANQTGVSTILTASPSCKRDLASLNGSDARIIDLMEFFLELLA